MKSNNALIVILGTVTLDAVGIGLVMPVLPGLLRDIPDIVPPFSKKPLKTRLEAPRGYASYCSAVAAANSASFRALLAAGSSS